VSGIFGLKTTIVLDMTFQSPRDQRGSEQKSVKWEIISMIALDIFYLESNVGSQ
jgi:hypothetical protein